MKQNVLALVAFVFLGFAAQGQISVGIKGGVNLAKLAYSEEGADSIDYDNKSVTGLSVGAVIEIGLTNNFAIQAEANFIQKGGRQQIDGDILGQKYSIKQDITFNYLEVPVFAKLKFGGETVGAYVLAGPSFGYGLSGKSVLESVTPFGSEKEEEDIDWSDDEVNRTDLGLNAGVGVHFGLGAARLFLDARYNLGLTNLYDGENSDDNYIKNRGVGINVGFLYGL